MKITFHSGPHKTATTSIQNSLLRNHSTIERFGVAVPASPAGWVGFPELPWAIKKWDLWFLNPEAKNQDASVLITQEIERARRKGCSNLIFSAEDLSLLSLDQWAWLFSECQKVSETTRPPRFVVTYANRAIDEVLPSAYATLVHLGLSAHFRDMLEPLRAHFRRVHERFLQLPDIHPDVTLLPVDYSRRSFTLHWYERVLPMVDSSLLVGLEEIHNVSRGIRVVERIRERNAALPVDFSINELFNWPSFHSRETFVQLQTVVHEIHAENFENFGT